MTNISTNNKTSASLERNGRYLSISKTDRGFEVKSYGFRKFYFVKEAQELLAKLGNGKNSQELAEELKIGLSFHGIAA